MKPRTLLLSLGAAALAAAGVWYVFTPAPVAVEIATVTRGPLRVTLTEQGETRARERFVVTSPAAGRVARIALHEGDAVTAGQAVATLHVAPVSAAEREAQLARVAAAQAGVREAQELVKKAQSGLDQAVREQVRAERLVREGFIASQAAEQARSAEASARAERAAADARLRAAMAQTAAATASLTPADPSVASHPIALRAPAGGRVLRIPERSERVVAAGTPLLVIGDPHALEVVADFLSTDAVRIRPGMPAELTGWGGAALVPAIVRLVEPSAFTKVSALGVEEQRVNVVLDMPAVPATIGDGFRVEASIVVADVPDALKVPASAVFRTGSGRAAFVVSQGRAVLRAIEGGLANRDELEVRGGLAAGEAVVRYPTSALADGTRVAPRP